MVILGVLRPGGVFRLWQENLPCKQRERRHILVSVTPVNLFFFSFQPVKIAINSCAACGHSHWSSLSLKLSAASLSRVLYSFFFFFGVAMGLAPWTTSIKLQRNALFSLVIFLLCVCVCVFFC